MDIPNVTTTAYKFYLLARCLLVLVAISPVMLLVKELFAFVRSYTVTCIGDNKITAVVS